MRVVSLFSGAGGLDLGLKKVQPFSLFLKVVQYFQKSTCALLLPSLTGSSGLNLVLTRRCLLKSGPLFLIGRFEGVVVWSFAFAD